MRLELLAFLFISRSHSLFLPSIMFIFLFPQRGGCSSKKIGQSSVCSCLPLLAATSLKRWTGRGGWFKKREKKRERETVEGTQRPEKVCVEVYSRCWSRDYSAGWLSAADRGLCQSRYPPCSPWWISAQSRWMCLQAAACGRPHTGGGQWRKERQGEGVMDWSQPPSIIPLCSLAGVRSLEWRCEAEDGIGVRKDFLMPVFISVLIGNMFNYYFFWSWACFSLMVTGM